MSLISGIKDFVGLDIGTNVIRAVQLKGEGEIRALQSYGFMQLDGTFAQSDAIADRQRLAQSVKQLFSESKITSKNVAVGLPSKKVFTTLADIEKVPDSEIAQSIKLQADALIPTSLDDSKIDWSVLGPSQQDPNKLEVLLTSVVNEYVESRLDMLESVGLNVIAFEPESMAIVRSLVAPGTQGLVLVVDIGAATTDVVALLDGTPRLTRSIGMGLDGIIKAASHNLSIDTKQAAQFVGKFGLSQNKLEGQVYSAISPTVDTLIVDIEKSVKFVLSRYPNTKLSNAVVTGGASTLPEFPLYLANKLGVSVEIGNSWRNISFAPEMQNDLLAVSNHFSAAVGLALRKE